MQGDIIADRYARALLAVATERNQAEGLLEQVEAYRKVAAASCAPFLENPKIPREAKEGLLKKIFSSPDEKPEWGASLIQILIPLVHLLLRKNRIRYLSDVFRLYAKRYAEQKGIVTAKLYVAHPMETALMDRLRAKLSARLGRTVTFDVISDPSLLGGFIVSTDTALLDASLRRALFDLGEQLKTVPV